MHNDMPQGLTFISAVSDDMLGPSYRDCATVFITLYHALSRSSGFYFWSAVDSLFVFWE